MWATGATAGRRCMSSMRPVPSGWRLRNWRKVLGITQWPKKGVPMRDIAEVIGRGLKVSVISVEPEDAPAHFGWLAAFAGRDLPASSAITKKRLGWQPTGPGLIADLENMRYFENENDVVSTAPARAAR